MKYKVWVLYLAFAPLWVFSEESDSLSFLEQQILVIEEAIAQAEINSSYCQMSGSWRFPVKLYGYIENAKAYSKKQKPKFTRKYFQCLVLIRLSIDEAIQGKPGYWSGNSGEIWVDPVPPVPECAIETFKDLQKEMASLNF